MIIYISSMNHYYCVTHQSIQLHNNFRGPLKTKMNLGHFSLTYTNTPTPADIHIVRSLQKSSPICSHACTDTCYIFLKYHTDASFRYRLLSQTYSKHTCTLCHSGMFHSQLDYSGTDGRMWKWSRCSDPFHLRSCSSSLPFCHSSGEMRVTYSCAACQRHPLPYRHDPMVHSLLWSWS